MKINYVNCADIEDMYFELKKHLSNDGCEIVLEEPIFTFTGRVFNGSAWVEIWCDGCSDEFEFLGDETFDEFKSIIKSMVRFMFEY